MTASGTGNTWLKPSHLALCAATAINLVPATFAALAAYHWSVGHLQAQEDFEAAMLLFTVGPVATLIALITFVAGMVQRSKGGFSNGLAAWALGNVILPWVLLFGLKWLIRG